MDYSKDIIDILLKAPQGLSVRKIVRHVYNAHNSLFESADIEDIKRFVGQYLSARSKTSKSPIEHAEERGVYRLNLQSQESQQLMLHFRDDAQELSEDVKNAGEDTSLDLFEGMYE